MTMSGTSDKVDPQRAALYLRLLGGDLGQAQLWFDRAVLDRYRFLPGWRVMRTYTAGPVRSPEGRSLTSCIAESEQLVLAGASALSHTLHASERQHLAHHNVTP